MWSVKVLPNTRSCLATKGFKLLLLVTRSWLAYNRQRTWLSQRPSLRRGKVQASCYLERVYSGAIPAFSLLSELSCQSSLSQEQHGWHEFCVKRGGRRKEGLVIHAYNRGKVGRRSTHQKPRCRMWITVHHANNHSPHHQLDTLQSINSFLLLCLIQLGTA